MFRPIKCLLGLIVILMVGLTGVQPADSAQERFYTVHVSSCQLPENAEQEVANLKGRGFEAFSRQETVPGKGMWYRVYVGRFNTAQEAAQFGNRLKAQGVATYTEVRPITGYGMAAMPKASTKTSTSPGRFDSLLQTTPAASPQTPPPAETVATSPPPSEPEPIMPEAAVESPQPAEPIEPEPAVQTEEVGSSGEVTPYWETGKSNSHKGPFTLTTKMGADFWGEAEGFRVTTNSGGNKREFWIDDTRAFHFAVVPSYRVYDFLSVDGGLELMKAGNLSAWYLTLGTRATYEFEQNFAPYFRAGLVYGSMNWDGLPGDFENSLGWEAGLGLDYLYEQMRFGVELQYRNILFDYNEPEGAKASASGLDLSGFSMSGSFGYNF